MNNKLLQSILGKKQALDCNRPLPPALLKKLEEEFALAWTYNSNAIEGNTLTLQETEIVLNSGVTIGGKTVKDHFEVVNHRNGIDFVKSLIAKKEPLTENTVRQLHALILQSIDDTEAGHYRRQNVRILGARHIPPQSLKVPRLMSEFIAWFHENEYILSP
ncbi:MAG: Fic family protein, partial [Candidatus Electrothrix sp. MAN1_4]|nr:Fic family protein [Candidatus Electrothrix sp. MAN1_4]